MTAFSRTSNHRLLNVPDPLPGQPSGLWSYAIPPLCDRWLAPLIRHYGASWSIKWHGLEHIRSTVPSSGWILASWHEALLMNMYSQRDRGLVAVVSPSWEGEIIARTMKGLGFGLARGSSGHKPMHAIRESVRLIRSGSPIGWVVDDGPVGPRRSVKPGALHIASLAQCAIVPMHSVTQKHWNLPSWDRQVIPYPGATIAVGFGEPIRVPKGLRGDDLQEHVAILSKSLMAIEMKLVDLLAEDA